ncbi:SDR family NAD(P)-dependent oxidoreductase [Streptomyces malaysiensis subsp. malaysiensis]|uniref:type I polyketide synthase n=1 Tax=Streptomyces malaysiensis TaxID=92644 RepID=UPI0024C0E2D7|nr:type I polyketide synthase [Streptomyces sp. NA07423]WHX22549.1 SDR family NAD(P)-dependent oxidoreductase [Streptomyces sp. NA07423]
MAASREDLVKALRTSLMDAERLRRENDRLIAESTEPVAIVATACRLPGGVTGPESLWELVDEGRDAIGPFPTDRGWDLDTLFDSDPDAVGKSYVREAGFLEGAGEFDAAFFGISPREALSLDPQQRLLLETAWETFERAGMDPRSVEGRDIAVFAGGSGQGYGGGPGAAPKGLEGYLGVGASGSVISGRVSYTLGLTGPAVTVDTACSSSLVATHLAVQALRSGECSMALAGGVAVMGQPTAFVEFSRQRGLAPDGRCKSFGEGADGTTWSEGVGLVLLERLSDARRNGHQVLAVIRGTAVNQDGASNGLTAPNGPSQERVIRQALSNAGLTVADVDTVEAHGTGTALGDPIEAQAVLATYGRNRPAGQPLWLGSLKSNIGHAQAAAGIASVIKTVMALRHGRLPKTLHAEHPTTKVNWTEGAVSLLTEARQWPETEHPRRAGISSFGVSGTNAHIIVEQAPAEDTADQESPTGSAEPAEHAEPGPVATGPVVPWVLSGHTEAALRAQAARLLTHVREVATDGPWDVGWSLATTRTRLDHRAVVLCADAEEAVAGLAAVASGASARSVVTGSVASGKVAVLFTGQGSQRAGMGRELHGRYPVFARSFDDVCAHFGDLRDGDEKVSLAEVVFADEGSATAALLDRTEFTQPALFALEVALFRLVESWGVRPAYVLGHSIGEVAAAHVAGVLSLPDACTLVRARGRLMQRLDANGAMVAVEAAEDEVAPLLTGQEHRASIAAINGPTSVVVSGNEDVVTAVAETLARQGRKTKRLVVSHAFHSPHMDGMLDAFREVASRLTYSPPRVPVVSNLTGGVADPEELCSPEYWVRHVRGAVRFLDGVRTLADEGVRTHLELGPDGVLTAMGQDCLPDAGAEADTAFAAFVPSLRPGVQEAHATLAGLAGLYVRGVPVDWDAMFAGSGARRVALPTYAFQHEHYWLERPAGSGDVGAVGLGAAGHPLLGAVVQLPETGGVQLSGRLSVRAQPWLGEHIISGAVLVPGTAMVELAIRAGDETGTPVLEELVIGQPMLLPGDTALSVQVVAGADEGGRRTVRIYSRADGATDWTEHATGTLVAQGPAPLDGATGEWPPAEAEPIPVEDFYRSLVDAGYAYGPAFRGLAAAWRLDGEVFGEVALPEAYAEEAERFGIHPALLDAALHAGNFCLPSDPARQVTLLPFAWNNVRLYAGGASAVRVQVRPAGDDAFSVRLTDGSGRTVASVEALTLRAVDPAQLETNTADDALWTVRWSEHPLPDGTVSWAPLGEAAAGSDTATEGTLPDVLVADTRTWAEDLTEPLPARARELTGHLLEEIQRWVTDDAMAGTRLAVVTRGAVAVHGDAEVTDPAAAAVWGLVRSAQAEHPGRLALVDADGACEELPAGVWSGDEPQLAVRGGTVWVPRLARVEPGLRVPEQWSWHLDSAEYGTLDNLALLPDEARTAPLEAGRVRIEVRAAGLNFRDVLVALGMYPGRSVIGTEGAGVVTEVGPDVSDLAVGDRVMGLFSGSFGPLATADARTVIRMPEGWSFGTAAGVPVAYLTALYALQDLGKVRPGETVLVHAAAGGVGMAAVQLAQHLGATVLGTAHPSKHHALHRLGVPAERLASSRDLGYAGTFPTADVVLNSLTGEHIDASLSLLGPGGRFLEMGKTDLREPGEVEARHPEVTYRAFDLGGEAPADRVRELLRQLVELFEAGRIEPLPVRHWDITRAPEAFRWMSQGRHTGKIVLTIPRTLDPDGTVLVTGGTGTLGATIARHLITHHGARHLLLISRQGPNAPGATELATELTELGATVHITACDTADRHHLTTTLANIPSDHPLTAVIHTAGTLDDGTLTALTPERLDTVFRPKVDAITHLHDLTRDQDLAAFVVYSSAAGVLGGPGQGNYSAANAYLDGLAQWRRARGLPATSLAWGMWAETSGMTAGLGSGDLHRVRRGGIVGLSTAEALDLFDRSVASGLSLLMPLRFDFAALGAEATEPPPLLRGLVRPARRTARPVPKAAEGGLVQRLAGLPTAEQQRLLVELTREETASVLGFPTVDPIGPEQAFRDLGIDSLTAVELRNRLNTATGLRLPATLVFDHPTALATAEFLRDQLGGRTVEAAPRPTHRRRSAPDGAEDPIVVVGMGCRLPGDVRTPEDLWRLVAAGTDAIGPFPQDRGWDLAGLFDPDPDAVGKSYVREGGFLTDAGGFDAAFFGISPREALSMDPQQRVLLETAWETLEGSGIVPTSLRGQEVGVFVGASGQGYGTGPGAAPEGLEGYLGVGGATSVASGRVSYTFGLTGPAVTVDTACSSSLVAIHLAVQALRSGECTMALAGGVAVMGQPGAFVEFSRQRGLASDGRCKSFGEGADGTNWSEGVGLLLLERLSDARRDGHEVLAVIRGTAVNQDGASNGLTAPNGPSQQRVIRQALANAGLTAADVDAVEAHGTGTALGDPIEAQALLATYGQERAEDQPLWLGSLKSNIGHTQAAAGVSSVIKMVLALRHGTLPRSLHADEPTAQVDWTSGAVSLLAEARPWPVNGHPRRAGISSFGVSGTNAHVVLEQAPNPEPAPKVDDGTEIPGLVATGGIAPWVLSAKTATALRAQAQCLLDHLESGADAHPVDIGWSLATTRTLHDHRAVILADTTAESTETTAALTALASGQPHPRLTTGHATTHGKTAFVFPGQGAQWAGMGAQLLTTSPVFAERLHECAAALAPYTDWNLIDVITGTPDAPSLDRVDVVQPATFAVVVSLAALWQSCGIHPDAVIGHSQGEIAAACVAGHLPLPTAAKIITLRSQTIAHHLAGHGGMMSLAAPADTIDLTNWHGKLWIAAHNGPNATVIAGDTDALHELHAHYTEQGIRARIIPVDYASHTGHVDTIEDELHQALADTTTEPGTIPWLSTVTGQWTEPHTADGDYWYRNLRQTVQFDTTIRTLADDGYRTFIEISPHPVLTTAIQETLETTNTPNPTITGTLRRNDDTPTRFLTHLAELSTRGTPMDWPTAYTGSQPSQIPLPTYPFQHETFWLDRGGPGDVRAVGLEDTGHPLVGAVVSVPDTGGVLLTGRLSLPTHPWLADHAVSGTVLLPGTAMVELAVRAGDEADTPVLEELVISRPMTVPDEGTLHVQVLVGGEERGRRKVGVYSRPEGIREWTEHATGTLTAGAAVPPEEAEAALTWPPEGAEPVALEGFYEHLAEVGYEYGPAFRGLRAVWKRDDEVFAEVSVPEEQTGVAGRFGIHPALLDATLHAGNFCFQSAGERPTMLPFAWTDVRLHAVGATAVRVRATVSGGDGLCVRITDPRGVPVATIGSLQLRETTPDQLRALAAASGGNALWAVEWAECGLGATEARWATVGESGLPDAPSSYADVPEVAGAGERPEVLVADVSAWVPERTGPIDRTHALCARVLDLLREWVDRPELADTRLVVLTRGAMAVHDTAEVTDPAAAAVWGLVRSAQSEHPGRVQLIDVDGHSHQTLPTALTAAEAQLALRDATAYTPHLTAAPTGTPSQPLALAPEGTVLITGGTGTLGALTARHLITQHGARDLLLVSRQGPDAPGAARLGEELTRLGARIHIAACDTADRDQLAAVLDGIPADHPLTAVVHTAGTLDDALLTDLTPRRLDTVLRPKVDALTHLHDLTRDLDLAAFVVFSSATGVLGTPGQANYAAANTYADALAQQRHAAGLPATSLAWGLWETTSALTAGMTTAQQQRTRHSGVIPLTDADGMRLLDTALTTPHPHLVPLELDLAALRNNTDPHTLPPLLRGLVRGHHRPTAHASARPDAAPSLAQELAALDPAQRHQRLTELVRAEAAAVLGHPTPDAVGPDDPLFEIGFDSLTAVELRNRLNAATGLQLAAAMLFDYPTPSMAAEHLQEQLALDATNAPVAAREAAEDDDQNTER